MKAHLPANEEQRLASLRDYDVLDTDPELGFDDLTMLASQICQTPVALVSLIDEHRQWFKSNIGLNASETSRDVAFCAHAILNPTEVLEVCDAEKDSRFTENPLVTEDPHIRFYAGAPLVTLQGYALGTLCVIDFVPRNLSEPQKYALQALSRHVVTLFELRLRVIENKKIELALRESEVRFRDLIESAHDLIQIIDLDGAVLYVNRAWRETMGYNEAEIGKLALQDFIHPDSLDQYKVIQQQVIENNKLFELETVMRTQSGRQILVEGNSTCRFKEGKPFSIRSFFRDVTESKKSKEQLQAILEKQRAILANAGYAIISTTTEGVITSFNPAAEKMLGYKAIDLVGIKTPAILHDVSEVVLRAQEFSVELGENIEPGFDVFVAKSQHNLPNEHEWTYVHKDGKHFPVILSVTALRDEVGEITGYLGMAMDITERKKLQLALEQFKYTLDQTVDCVFISNIDDFRFEYVNKGAILQVGYSEAELYKMVVPDIEPEYSPDQYKVLVQPLLDGKQASLIFETSHRHKDGHEIPVEVNLQVVRFEHLSPRLVSIVRDITERKNAEKLLHTKNTELKAFAYTVSHDLKAPLRGIAGYAQELERRHKTGLSERAQFCISQVITASHNLDCLIEDLLTYSRVDADTPTQSNINLSALLKSILADRSHAIAEQGVEVTLDVQSVVLLSWERGLHQVLTNLIDNAIKYSRNAKSPHLSISAVQTSAGCQIKVADNGIGFDMKYHDRIFGLFNRLVRADEFEGSGAGLAIVKKLIEKLGGTIHAESALDQGATFVVELPQSPTTKVSI